MKGKFKFSNINKEEKTKENKEVNHTESEVFNINELQKYYAEFTEKSKKIEENFNVVQYNFEEEKKLEMNPNNIILSDNESKLKFLEEINNSIKELREDYKLNASFMSNYDQHNYLNILDNLTKKYNDYKEKISPKKKFAFSNKNAAKNISDISSKVEEISSTKNETNFIENTQKGDEIVISNKSNEKIIITHEDVKDRNSLFIENLQDCEVYILFNFKALYAKDIKGSKLYVGSISGGSHITNCIDSNIFLITHQLRIHKTHNTKFSIIVSSNPIIEDCTELIFSNLKIKYRDLENNLLVIKHSYFFSLKFKSFFYSFYQASGIDLKKNKWNSVLDFKWHKREKSPNFDYDENNDEINLEF